MFKFISFSLLFSFLISSSLAARDINIDQLAAEAAKAHKHLLVWLHKTDCGYCEAMREFTLEDDKNAALMEQSFVFVHINVSENDKVSYKTFTGSGKTFAVKVGYNFYPSSLFFDGNADIVFAAAGYIEESNFGTMLRFVESDAYRTSTYEAFRAQEKKR